MTTTPTIRFGIGIDQYLGSHGAIAQAFDRNTILASSQLLSMSRSDVRLVLLHELAHLQQLATTGNDPEPLLEEEAWEAAHAWSGAQSAGGAFRIRGRARHRLNATAIIQGGKIGHPDAPDWYRGNPLEPIGPNDSIEIKKSVVLDPLSIDSLLDQIIQSNDPEVLVVNHGHPEGLDTTLFNGQKDPIARDMISFLSLDKPTTSQDGLGMSLKLPAKSDKEVATIAKITEAQVVALRKKMNAVRAMNLKHIAFRACNMGSDSDTMETYRSFFGAKSISAPSRFDTYGHFPITTGDIGKWAQAQLKTGWNVWTDGGVAFATSKHYTGIKYQISAMGTDGASIGRWVKAHISDHVNLINLLFHGIRGGMMTSTEQSVFFVKDPGFRSLIVSYP